MRKILEAGAFTDVVIVDLRRVSRVDPPSVKLLVGLLSGLRERGKRILLSDLRRHREVERHLAEGLGLTEAPGPVRILNRSRSRPRDLRGRPGRRPDPGRRDIVAGSAHRARSAPGTLAQGTRRGAGTSAARELSARRGFRAPGGCRDIFLLTRGEVSVVVELPGGQAKRLATLSAGMTFGELAVIGGTTRSADVRADTDIECYVLPRQAWERLAETNAAARLTTLENMLRLVSSMATSLTAEVAALGE